MIPPHCFCVRLLCMQAHMSQLDTQLAAGLPVQAMRGVQLAQVSDSLLTALPAASVLLCKELGENGWAHFRLS